MKTILISIGVTLIIGFTFGFYLEQFEKPTARLIYLQSISDTPSIKLTNDNFLMYALFSKIQKLSLKYNLYGAIKVFFNTLFIALIVNTLLKIKRAYSFLIVLLALLLFTPSFAIINSSVLALLFIFIAAINLYLSKHSKISLITYIVLVVLGLFYRIEIAFIALFLFVLFSIFFLKKPIKKTSFIGLCVGAVFLFSFHLLVSLNLDGLQDYYRYEKEYNSKNNTVVANNNALNNSLSKTEVKQFAKALFLTDIDQLKNIKHRDVLKYNNIYKYIFNNPSFKGLLIKKLNDLFDALLEQHILALGAIFILFTYLVMQLNYRLKLLSTCYVVLIGLLLVYFNFNSDVSYYFLYPFLVCSYLLLLIITIHIPIERKKHIILISITLMLFHSIVFSKNKLKTIKQENLRAFEYMNEFQSNQSSGNLNIIAYIYFEELLPGKLFYNYFKDYNLFFLEYGPITQIPYYYNKNQKLFGKAFNNFKERCDWVINNNNGYIYSDDFMKNFIPLYLKKVYNYNVEFCLQDDFNHYAIKKYKIKRIDFENDCI